MRPDAPQHRLKTLSSTPSTPLPLPFTTNPLLQDSSSPLPNKHQDLRDQFPASFRTGDDICIPQNIPDLGHLSSELIPTRLNQRIRYLWLAGRPVPPRPLHHQLLLGREIFISERIDLHLVWGGGRILVKPIPRYLLHPDFWSKYLLSPSFPDNDKNNNDETRTNVRQCAMGFLMSYVALITYESDFRIAVEKGLIPPQVSWCRWRRFVREMLNGQHSDSKTQLWGDVAERFIYGELRLNRLNLIEVVLRGPLSRGFLATWTSFGGFYQHSSAVIIAGAAYILLILSAMQVGLGTTRLAEDEIFQAASYGFTVFSILGPLGAVMGLVVAFVVALLYNTIKTKSFEAKRSAQLGRTWGSGHVSKV